MSFIRKHACSSFIIAIEGMYDVFRSRRIGGENDPILI